MEIGFPRAGMESILEGILLISLGVSALCVVGLGTMMIVGRWRHEMRQREKANRRRLQEPTERQAGADRSPTNPAAREGR